MTRGLQLSMMKNSPESCLMCFWLLVDDFGWDDRIKVATQLADLLAWLHEKRVAVGSVTASCIMIDEEVNIKVFDFGHFSNHVSDDCKIHVRARVGREVPEVVAGERTMKSDVYIFGLLLLELIRKKNFNFRENPFIVESSVLKEATLGEIWFMNVSKKLIIQLHLISHVWYSSA